MRDGDFVVGWDEAAPAFFWLAAQGGYGIQTAAAASELAAALVERQPVPDAARAHGVDALAMRPPPALIPFSFHLFSGRHHDRHHPLSQHPAVAVLARHPRRRLPVPVGPDPDGRRRQVVRGDIREQTHAAIARIKDTLALANASLADVVRVTVWLTDLAQFADFNEAYRQHFPADFPTRSTVEARLALEVDVEIEVQAWVGDRT